TIVATEKNEPVKLLQGLMIDITERKHTQESLEAEKERLAVTLRSIGDGVIATNAGGRIVLINEVGEKMTGWTQESAIGKELPEVFHIVDEKMRKRCENPVKKVLRTNIYTGLTNNTMLISRD